MEAGDVVDDFKFAGELAELSRCRRVGDHFAALPVVRRIRNDQQLSHLTCSLTR
jgi:hypothetical protein